MKDLNRLRLERMIVRHERHLTERAELDAATARRARFLAETEEILTADVLPVIEEIGQELARAGHGYRVERGPAKLDLYLSIQGRTGSKDLIQFFVHEDAQRGCELIVELCLKRSGVQKARYQHPSELTRDVAEQLLVDTIEQI